MRHSRSLAHQATAIVNRIFVIHLNKNSEIAFNTEIKKETGNQTHMPSSLFTEVDINAYKRPPISLIDT